MTGPGELLDRLGVEWRQVTEPGYGYSGSFTPRCAFGHWTASAAGSDVSEDVLWSRCYHACVSRSGVVKLGGWQVRQGHGGEGRSSAVRLAITGAMTLDKLLEWQASTQVDDTSSMPNQYGYGVCLDNNGVGEQVPAAQFDAWCSAMAVFAVLAGATGPGWVIDHSGSTNRKIDLSGSPAIPVAEWWEYVNLAIEELLTGPPTPRRRRMFQYWQDDHHQLWLSDGMNIRWLETDWAVANAVAQLKALGLPTDPSPTYRRSILNNEIGVVVGDMPPS